MPNSNQSCSLQIDSEISEFSKKQLKIIKGRIELANLSKSAVLFSTILSFFTPSSKKRVLAAKGSTDTTGLSIILSSLDKALLKLIESDIQMAAVRTQGTEHQAWRKMLVCVRSKV